MLPSELGRSLMLSPVKAPPTGSRTYWSRALTGGWNSREFRVQPLMGCAALCKLPNLICETGPVFVLGS